MTPQAKNGSPSYSKPASFRGDPIQRRETTIEFHNYSSGKQELYAGKQIINLNLHPLTATNYRHIDERIGLADQPGNRNTLGTQEPSHQQFSQQNRKHIEYTHHTQCRRHTISSSDPTRPEIATMKYYAKKNRSCRIGFLSDN